MAHPAPEAFVASPAPRRNVSNAAGIALIFAGFFTFMFGTLAAALTGIVHPALVAGLGFVIIGAGGAVMTIGGEPERRTLPAPPVVQPPPQAPAGKPGAIEVACPNCGAFPKAIDRFGVAVCEYCATRYLVR